MLERDMHQEPSAEQTDQQARPRITVPSIPVLSVNTKEAVLMSPDGELRNLPHDQAKMELHKKPVLVCHAPYTRAKLGASDLYAYDILELYAFIYPAQFCVPTPFGLAKALGLSVPSSLEDYPFTLIEATQALLEDFSNLALSKDDKDPLDIAEVMAQQGKGWPWTPFLFAARGQDYDPQRPVISKNALNIWRDLPEWSEEAPPPPPSHHPVTEDEATQRLTELLRIERGHTAENRPEQIRYTAQMAQAFAPLSKSPEETTAQGEERCPPHLVLGEAGTGVGKTLGYLAPASVWSEKNDGSVWISTYTKNLQSQIDDELSRLYPHPDVKDAKVAVRKGRENYLCLLNFEDTATGAGLAKHPNQAIAAGLMARWLGATKDGDLTGKDFPGWLPGLLGYKHTRGLSDRRGECIYAACDHYHRCFVEKAVRKSKYADMVVANHALVMIQTALATPLENLPQRYVFDEGHHIFDAADSAFSGHLTAREAHDLRRWIKGAEGGKQTRARGLKKRVEDLIAEDHDLLMALEDIIHAASALPNYGWSRRLRDKEPQGATEKFLRAVYQQVYDRAAGRDGPYSLETETRPLADGVLDVAMALKDKLTQIQTPMRKLSAALKKKLNDQADTLDPDTKKRIESVSASIDRRCEHYLAAWISMLDSLKSEHPAEDFVDWMEVERIDGHSVDVGLYRHWIDPLKPFSESLKSHAHGIAITSATLKDRTEDETQNWRAAKETTGAAYFTDSPVCFSEESPYDYAAQSRVFIITDLQKHNMPQMARACEQLFIAAQGGGLGLFTAIQRLREVHQRIAQPLESAGYPLYAQHADEIDTGTLVDMFREDQHACLLGTDAVRDGVDVPGDALRLLIYDRVPWPRPTLLHKARRKAFGGRRYDERITRLKIRQAFGRLIRRADDYGVFIMLDSMLPTRLLGAFPDGVPVERIGLAEAIVKTQAFLAEKAENKIIMPQDDEWSAS